MNKNFNNEISLGDIEKSRKKYVKKNLKTLENSVLKNGIRNTVLNNESIVNTNHVFSENIKTGKVANQKQSGRCWIFAALNTFRHKLNKDFNLENFELSQTYTFFWDKYEKSNYFLENIIKTVSEPLDGRLVNFLLTTPQQDGGQWDMLVSLIEKYGVVPKSAMPEVFESSNSMALNDLLNKKLRLNAHILRTSFEKKSSIDELFKMKSKMMDEIYSFLSVALGEPPKEVNFEYYDKDSKFHRDLNIKPQEFFNKYVGIDLKDYISIINAPTKDKPYHKTFTVDFLGNVIGGRDVKYLNVSMKELKELTISQIKAGETVWFGCDVGQFYDRVQGIMDTKLYNYNDAFGMNFNFTKEESLDYCESLMTHAMVLSGVNIVDEKPNRWKIENSWGEENGAKGFYVMTDEWMDRFTYQVVINKKYLPKKLLKIFEEEPIHLKPWDPMGSLAIVK